MFVKPTDIYDPDSRRSLGADTTTRTSVPTWRIALGTVGAAAGAYHGYKRNNGSYLWAILWSVGASFMPFILGPVMFAQGFGKRK